eukprot:1177925-Prorocentrum_minimum.AAC.2
MESSARSWSSSRCPPGVRVSQSVSQVPLPPGVSFQARALRKRGEGLRRSVSTCNHTLNAQYSTSDHQRKIRH